jgi:hypothetical protein
MSLTTPVLDPLEWLSNTIQAPAEGGLKRPSPDDASPGDLARRLWGPAVRPGRHLDLLDRVYRRIDAGEIDRVIVTISPRRGKSERVLRWGPLWWLRRHPKHRVVGVSYGAELAEGHGRWVRDMIKTHPGLGLTLERGSHAANRFDLTTGGGMFTLGTGGPLTGRGADLLLIDDPIKAGKEADSKTIRETCWEWWQSTALTRLEPGAAVIVVQQRVHLDDLVGRLLAEMEEAGEQAEKWEVVDIPEVATGTDREGKPAPDPLGRKPGQILWPERYTPEQVARTRRNVGGRVWECQFQQRPSTAEGVIIKRAWYKWCTPAQHGPIALIGVGVDPAVTSGEQADNTGIIVAGRLAGERSDHAVVLDDRTVHDTPAGWGRAVCLAVLDWGAHVVVVEANQGGEMCAQTIRIAWRQLASEGRTHGRACPPIVSVHARDNKRIRAEPVAARYEGDQKTTGGTVWHLAPGLPKLENEMCTWAGEDDSPDRLDANVTVLTHLLGLGAIVQRRQVEDRRLSRR